MQAKKEGMEKTKATSPRVTPPRAASLYEHAKLKASGDAYVPEAQTIKTIPSNFRKPDKMASRTAKASNEVKLKCTQKKNAAEVKITKINDNCDPKHHRIADVDSSALIQPNRYEAEL